MAELHQIAAALYLAAGLVSGLCLALPAPRALRRTPLILAAGAVFHALSFALLHRREPTPALTDLPTAASFMALVAVLFSLALFWRDRLASLTVGIGPVAFLFVFVAALRQPEVEPSSSAAAGSWPHLHVLLASGGLALLGVAGLVGMVFLLEHRRLKAKRPLRARVQLPTLEALDRANRAALALGFPLLTLGVITGMIWVQHTTGSPFSGAAHQSWSVVAWCVYAVLAGARFLSRQGSRQAAASAVGGFAFLFFAVIGLGIFT